MGKKEEKHLPVYGIGPMLCWELSRVRSKMVRPGYYY